MVDSNLQRENILPSERTAAYKMKVDEKKIALTPTVEISYLEPDEQRLLLDTIFKRVICTISMKSIGLSQTV